MVVDEYTWQPTFLCENSKYLVKLFTICIISANHDWLNLNSYTYHTFFNSKKWIKLSSLNQLGPIHILSMLLKIKKENKAGVSRGNRKRNTNNTTTLFYQLHRAWNKETFTGTNALSSINILTHWGRDKMTAFSQTTLSNAFSWMKILEFRLKFHLSLFLRVQLTIIQHWFW